MQRQGVGSRQAFLSVWTQEGQEVRPEGRAGQQGRVVQCRVLVGWGGRLASFRRGLSVAASWGF